MNTLTIHPASFDALNHNSGTKQTGQISALCSQNSCIATNTVWRAFQDGMKILYQHAGRSRVDFTLIAKANLRLLHDTLLADPSYRERLTIAENEVPLRNSPMIDNLFISEGLCADLITLQPGCDAKLSSSDHHNHMYMLIYGKVVVNQAANLLWGNNEFSQHPRIQTRSWWKKLLHSSKTNVCKQRDIILFGQNDPIGKTVCALEHRCILLRISFSATYHPVAH